MPSYTIWTIGCQMNRAESQKIADSLEAIGYGFTSSIQQADLVVLNTCVVRQSAEDRVLGMLGYLKGIKGDNPDALIIVTGCFVNPQAKELEERFPHVAFFNKPGAYRELVDWVQVQRRQVATYEEQTRVCGHRIAPTAFVPIIQGCNNFCSYCIVPYRRGIERSRPVDEIVAEVNTLVDKGVREVTLLGQNVNSYGHDLPQKTDLSGLLCILNSIEGLVRIRFLTNHPKDMNLKLVETVACLDKVCEHLNLPLQSGDDIILKAMRRDYTAEQYYNLVDTIRGYIPRLALSTDVIVGFCGETNEQFHHTLALVQKARFDTVHIAMYSPREGTLAYKFADSVPAALKKERAEAIETSQTQIAGEINTQFQDKEVEVLVEGEKRGKWYGRTRSNKLVFFEGEKDYWGRLEDVLITKTSPWALQGRIENR